MRQTSAKKFGPLGHAGPHQKTTIAASSDGEFGCGGVFLGNQILRRRDKIIKHILLTIFGARFVPGLAIFATTTKVGHRIHPTHVDPSGNRNTECRGHGYVEAAISIQQGGVVTVEL